MQFAPYYRIVPNADTAALFIHGIAGTPAHFQPLIPQIPENWSVYNILLDGHGKGVKDFSRSCMNKWKQQVSAQMDEILQGHKQVVIVAHSMGTLFAIRQAILHKDRIKALFLLAVPLCPQLPPSTALNSIKTALGLVKPGTLSQDMAQGCGIRLSPNLLSYLGWIPRFWELLQEAKQVRKLLPRLQTPAWVYQSRKDELVAFRAYRHLENHPYIQLTVLEHSGHFAYRKTDLSLLQSQLHALTRRI